MIQQNELIKNREGCFGGCWDPVRHAPTEFVLQVSWIFKLTVSCARFDDIGWLGRKRVSYLGD